MTTISASAPGRLDVLGGVADYSGAWVLELPIAARTTVTIEPIVEARWVIVSQARQADIDTAALNACLGAAPDRVAVAAHLTLHRLGIDPWARYVIGSLLLVAAESGVARVGGARITVTSTVPEGMGVSSSAALEVAVARAGATWFGPEIDPVRLAHLAQRAENVVVGAPCGLMDQLTVSCGIAGALLPILCRPDLVGAPLPIPAGLAIAGWPSGHRHTVAGSPYGRARTAAFTALAAANSLLGRPLAHLSELDGAGFVALVAEVPEVMTATEIVAAGWTPSDPLSVLSAGERYPVRAAARFAAGEHGRVGRACQLFAAPSDADQFAELGSLLRASHDGYSSIGLDSPVTDAMVALLDELGPSAGFYGGRVSGGGSGGTVVVLADPAALDELPVLAAQRGLPSGPLIR